MSIREYSPDNSIKVRTQEEDVVQEVEDMLDHYGLNGYFESSEGNDARLSVAETLEYESVFVQEEGKGPKYGLKSVRDTLSKIAVEEGNDFEREYGLEDEDLIHLEENGF